MDIKELSEEQILKLLSKEATIPLYQDLSKNLDYKPAMSSFDEVMSYEDKLSRALSRGIQEQRGFHGKTRSQDIIKELSKDFDVDPPKLEFRYDPRLYGSMDTNTNTLVLNPEKLSNVGKESVIAHELRHLKEGPNFENGLDKSIRNILYTGESGNPMLDLWKGFSAESAGKKMEGKSLAYYNKLNERLFPKDKLKPSIDALEAYTFLEKGHFKTPFLAENLRRVAKGLPLIGAAATVAGGLGYSDVAGAVTDAIMPGGVEELGVSSEQKQLDRKYLQKIREINSRKKP